MKSRKRLVGRGVGKVHINMKIYHAKFQLSLLHFSCVASPLFTALQEVCKQAFYERAQKSLAAYLYFVVSYIPLRFERQLNPILILPNKNSSLANYSNFNTNLGLTKCIQIHVALNSLLPCFTKATSHHVDRFKVMLILPSRTTRSRGCYKRNVVFQHLKNFKMC